jgi:alpha-ketoglutarate-dependent taurine dioxygenase
MGRFEFFDQRRLPVIVTPGSLGLSADGIESLLAALRVHGDLFSELKLKHGAILFRDFGLADSADFFTFARSYFSAGPRPYHGGVSPRSSVAHNIYESTRVPPSYCIPQHHELSYIARPPGEICFYCEVEPTQGGETPLSDSRLIYRRLRPDLRDEFERKQLRYHRYLFGPKWHPVWKLLNRWLGFQCSWMETFSTTDQHQVEVFVKDQGLELIWDDRSASAMVSNLLPAVKEHPVTGEKAWFNMVTTFLVTPRMHGKPKVMFYEFMYPNPLTRPFHVIFGTGEPIPEAFVDSIGETIDAATVKFPWEKGDLLLIDNLAVAHGRQPFRGERKILAAMA